MIIIISIIIIIITKPPPPPPPQQQQLPPPQQPPPPQQQLHESACYSKIRSLLACPSFFFFYLSLLLLPFPVPFILLLPSFPSFFLNMCLPYGMERERERKRQKFPYKNNSKYTKLIHRSINIPQVFRINEIKQKHKYINCFHRSLLLHFPQ